MFSFILVLPWFFVIPGTIYETIYGSSKDNNTLFGQILLSFSMLSNTRILFRMVDNKSILNAQFQFVHGIRAIAAIFIVIAHTSGMVFLSYQMRVSVLARHPNDLIEKTRMVVGKNLDFSSTPASLHNINKVFLIE